MIDLQEHISRKFVAHIAGEFGYLMSLLGDLENGPPLIRKAIQVNPFYHVTIHHALFFGFVAKGGLRCGISRML